MSAKKKQFRIGHVAKHVGVKRFVLRFWEKEFNLAAHRSTGGQRFYELHDIEQFMKIKELLYEKGFTIAGAKKLLEEDFPQNSITPATQDIEQATISAQESPFTEQMLELHKKLRRLRELL